MKKSIVRITTVVWVIGLVLTGLMLSAPPANVPLYIGLACIAIFPLIFGSRRYQIFGIVAVAGSLMLAYWEYEAGLRFHARMERIKFEINQKQQMTNTPASQSQKP
ncbi:MAG TPA: hypothetical protein VFC17_14495 [Candidatus Limnocylindrales bacterium]|nr:hypothetical protein [Candidatus Limnocylindrales bacterium]